MKKLAATILTAVALVATLAPTAQAGKPTSGNDYDRYPCICLPLPEDV